MNQALYTDFLCVQDPFTALGQGCGLNMTENSTMSTTAPPPITTTTASSAVNNSVNSLSLMWDWWCNFGVYVVAAGALLNEDLKVLSNGAGGGPKLVSIDPF